MGRGAFHPEHNNQNETTAMNLAHTDSNGIIQMLKTRHDFHEAKIVDGNDECPHVEFVIYTPLGAVLLVAHRLPGYLRIYGLEGHPIGSRNQTLQLAAILTQKLAGTGHFHVNSTDGHIHYIAHYFLMRGPVPKPLLEFAVNEALAADGQVKDALKEIALEKMRAHRNRLLAEHIFAKQPLADPIRN